jgi:pimeloyl-ACP methyl ester carboxylesterase
VTGKARAWLPYHVAITWKEETMATYVLVHGGWDGGWHWRPIARLLHGAGHEAFPVTLTGLGERSHLASAQITLATHISDVVNVLRFEGLENVILAGHSYGGTVITGVAEREAMRLAHLVYIDAFVPRDGQSMSDILGPTMRAQFEERAREQGGGWLVPYDPPDGWDTHRRTALPIGVLYDPVWVRDPDAARIPRTYIACTETAAELGALGDGLLDAASRARADPAWRYHELPTGHSPMDTMPGELADLLLTVASSGEETANHPG